MSQTTRWLGDLGIISAVHITPLGKRDARADTMRIKLKGTAMQIVVGPVLTREGGYAFDGWTPEAGSAADTPTAGSKMLITHATSNSDLARRAILIT